MAVRMLSKSDGWGRSFQPGEPADTLTTPNIASWREALFRVVKAETENDWIPLLTVNAMADHYTAAMQNAIVVSAAAEYEYKLRQIALALGDLNLAPWWLTLHDWLNRHHGLEPFIGDDADCPAEQVLGLLHQYKAKGAAMVDAHKLLRDLSGLGFLNWRAKWPRWLTGLPAMHWNPIVSTFAEFAARHALLAPAVWESDSGFLSGKDWYTYLNASLTKH